MPTTVEPMKRVATELGVPCLLHDIDTDDVALADDLVRRYGDWNPDYLVPQVFLEFEGGEFRHVLTGDPKGLAFTRQALDGLINGQLFSDLRRDRAAAVTS